MLSDYHFIQGPPQNLLRAEIEILLTWLSHLYHRKKKNELTTRQTKIVICKYVKLKKQNMFTSVDSYCL